MNIEQVIDYQGNSLTYTPYKEQSTGEFINDCINNAMLLTCKGFIKKDLVLKAVDTIITEKQGTDYLVSSFEKYNQEKLSKLIDILVTKQKGKDLTKILVADTNLKEMTVRFKVKNRC